jgi:hypothetical protein
MDGPCGAKEKRRQVAEKAKKLVPEFDGAIW